MGKKAISIYSQMEQKLKCRRFMHIPPCPALLLLFTHAIRWTELRLRKAREKIKLKAGKANWVY